ncbi:MAG: hypothetical protein C0621_06390 [Desulfuromonas sp.]|nr:MAG: hypothetical protein C0621_06390 [Desulfuromonas sp.]
MSEKSTLTPEQKEIDKLIGQSDFAQARQQLLQMLEENEVAGNAVWIRQKLALSTYKDTHLRPESRYEKALEHLRAIGLEEKETDNSETLCLGGRSTNGAGNSTATKRTCVPHWLSTRQGGSVTPRWIEGTAASMPPTCSTSSPA